MFSLIKQVVIVLFSFSESLATKCLFLKVVSAAFLLVCFVCLKESTWETRKNVFYFTSKALFVQVFKCHDVIKCLSMKHKTHFTE